MTEAMNYQPADSFVRVATACPEVAVGDIETNVARVGDLYDKAAAEDASLVVFPELSLTGYTLGDLVRQRAILDGAKGGLQELAEKTRASNAAMVVGLPLAHGNALYNCAAVLSGGQIRGIVPKQNMPNDKEFYEKRWYQPWAGENGEVTIGDQQVPIGTDLLFKVGDATVGVEVCEDLWVPEAPSVKLAKAGATLVANPSASPEQIAKSNYRRQLVGQQSARLLLGYIYAGCDASESTTDIVMSGHQMVAESGRMLAERRALTLGQPLTFADVDLDHLRNDRLSNTNFGQGEMPVVECDVQPQQEDLRRILDAHPFVPSGPERAETLQTILDIQAQALATRMQNTGIKKMVLGLSGGLDSTLALLVGVRASERLGLPPSETIQTLTMPGDASSDRTQNNAQKLAAALGVENQVIPINGLAAGELAALGHDGVIQDITYENVQARLRTALLFNRANQLRGMVLGTGDLSEIALGWCTYNGDHMSHYNVNASIPKTLVKHLVGFAAELPEMEPARDILQSILDTPISPELTRSGSEGITQETEDIVGPYELHDFFLYNLARWNDHPGKIAYLAEQAFAETYDRETIDKWLGTFLVRFTRNQWKRSVATDGPKVGSVSLSPRGDWRMPSDMSPALWGEYATIKP